MAGRRGSVQVTTAGPGSRRPVVTGVLVVALVMILAAGGVVLAARTLRANPEVRTPSATLDAGTAGYPSAAPGPAGTPPSTDVPGSTRLVLLGPQLLIDTRGTRPAAPGSDTAVGVPGLPPGSTAALTEVSVLQATGPGVVTLSSDAGRVTALRVPGPGAQTSATVVTPISPNATLTVHTEGGGHLLVTVIGAFQQARSATAGRIVPVPPTQVVHLVPTVNGKYAGVAVSDVPVLAQAGSVAAVLLQISAEVGVHGGFVQVGAHPDRLDQQVFWSAAPDTDNVRGGFFVLPVTDGGFALHYQAGTDLRADVVGYLTDGSAPDEAAGLIVPVPQKPGDPVTVPPGADVPATVGTTQPGLPADRLAAAWLGVAARGPAVGPVTVHAPGTPPPSDPTITAATAAPRAATTLVGMTGGQVLLTAAAGADVTLTPQAFVLSNPHSS
jgi:hypothetical protein